MIKTPKIVWQTWKTKVIPQKFEEYIKIWIKLHPLSEGYSHIQIGRAHV